LEGYADASNLRAEHQRVHRDLGREWHDLEMDAEALADRARDGMAAHRGQPARHLDQERDAERGQGDRPEQLEPEHRARLRGRRDRADLEEPAHAGHDPQRDLQDLLHFWSDWASARNEAAGARNR
jgi:hypothetical protein